MGLIPEIPLTEFKKLKASEIREMKSVEVTADGVHLFTAIIPHGDAVSKDYAKTQAEYLGERSNVTGGADPVLEAANAL